MTTDNNKVFGKDFDDDRKTVRHVVSTLVYEGVIDDDGRVLRDMCKLSRSDIWSYLFYLFDVNKQHPFFKDFFRNGHLSHLALINHISQTYSASLDVNESRMFKKSNLIDYVNSIVKTQGIKIPIIAETMQRSYPMSPKKRQHVHVTLDPEAVAHADMKVTIGLNFNDKDSDLRLEHVHESPKKPQQVLPAREPRGEPREDKRKSPRESRKYEENPREPRGEPREDRRKSPRESRKYEENPREPRGEPREDRRKSPRESRKYEENPREPRGEPREDRRKSPRESRKSETPPSNPYQDENIKPLEQPTWSALPDTGSDADDSEYPADMIEMTTPKLALFEDDNDDYVPLELRRSRAVSSLKSFSKKMFPSYFSNA
jgi:hypothetical protein